jgi:hypothetical protein
MENQDIPCLDHHLWPVRHGRFYQQLRYRRHSSRDHMTTQAPPLRQSRDTYGGGGFFKYNLFNLEKYENIEKSTVISAEGWNERRGAVVISSPTYLWDHGFNFRTEGRLSRPRFFCGFLHFLPDITSTSFDVGSWHSTPHSRFSV